MLVSFLFARAGARRLGTGTILPLALAACSDGDLFIPDDRTPAQLLAISGDGQSAVAGSPVPNPLVVKALDRAGRAVEGAVILFQFVGQPDGAAIAPSAPETDPDGLASVEVTLGRPAGDQPVYARLDDTVSVRFLLTAIPSNSGGGGGEGDDDPPPDDGGDGGGDDEDGGGGKGKGKGKGHHGDGGGNDDNGGGNGDD